MKKLDTLFIGFMLFSMFFGAGNLIFPPVLGASSGVNYWLAMAGFIVTGVGLPFIVLLAISLVKGGVQTIGNRVHPVFSTIFTIAVYLCIGPFLAIPRNANVAFEMGVSPYMGGAMNKTLVLLLFSVIFFALVYLVSLNPSKMEKYMGRFITPTLLLAMVVLCVAGFVNLDSPFQQPTEQYKSDAFFTGFLEGYNTMDALAALAFGIVILSAIKKRGVKDSKQLRNYTLKASLIAGILLSIIYVSLGVIGARMAGTATFENGTEILSAAATLLLGQNGTMLLGLIFTLACFTTVVGLTTACGHYFSELIPKANYKTVVLVVTLVGFTLSNLGLNQILKVSVPFLVTAYPLTIVLITLTFFSRYYRSQRKVYGSAMLFTGVVAVMGGLHAFGLDLGPLQTIKEMLPLSSVELEWIVPALVGTGVGLVFDKVGAKPQVVENLEVKAS
ncbi:branched-chain amino acid transport system II carrier protein [Schinkia azotoformans]|uniref:branched-chain amino acid transport system II carrier protein n=1 Tax=Schinkia azotoformans TaxID=1454 RepID=UPI002DBCA9F5|nr:branched-chain amino acid transport system II carrier protein [Schinkia azotoformans]MEC1716074.1 branched-chain amino acid transport system II carrier protein [Schinkia azotoformans]MEC1740545.1 branched-chain amino acid transport system II carrier protein [Schinkia azotoformans]MEC1756113.1 branched-chain amino acid transport system II carrier protein [Schinkia azotoformans]MEC1768850.1 branched-chain amino acid transport system II carrier protein [Schinkia azotoformans]MEC1788406.1 branc